MGFEHYSSADGWVIIEGPSGVPVPGSGAAGGHGITQAGFDAIAYNTKTGDVHLVDNKSLSRQGNVQSATAIDPARNLPQNVDAAIVRLRAARDVAGRIKVLEVLGKTKAALAAGTPLPPELGLVVTGVGGQSTGVGGGLASRGVQFRAGAGAPAGLSPLFNEAAAIEASAAVQARRQLLADQAALNASGAAPPAPVAPATVEAASPAPAVAAASMPAEGSAPALAEGPAPVHPEGAAPAHAEPTASDATSAASAGTTSSTTDTPAAGAPTTGPTYSLEEITEHTAQQWAAGTIGAQAPPAAGAGAQQSSASQTKYRLDLTSGEIVEVTPEQLAAGPTRVEYDPATREYVQITPEGESRFTLDPERGADVAVPQEVVTLAAGPSGKQLGAAVQHAAPTSSLAEFFPDEPGTVAGSDPKLRFDPVTGKLVDVGSMPAPAGPAHNEAAKAADVEAQALYEEQAITEAQAEQTADRQRMLLSAKAALPGAPSAKPEEPFWRVSKNLDAASSLNATNMTAGEQQFMGVTGTLVPGSGLLGKLAVQGHRDFSSGYHKKPVVERVNPAYAAPPGRPQDVVDIQNQMLSTLDERAQVENVAKAASAQVKHHKANEKPLDSLQTGTAESLTATKAHQEMVARRAKANDEKKANEERVGTSLGEYPQHASKLQTLVTVMRGFQRFTGLASSLPDDPSILQGAKRSLLRTSAGCKKFIGKFDELDGAVKEQESAQGPRKEGIAADAKTIATVETDSKASGKTLEDTKTAAENVATDNAAKREEADALKARAGRTGASLGARAAGEKMRSQSLAAALDSWAQAHQQARLDALAQTKARMEARGYTGVQVSER
ncbi:MAG: hypothetical protein QOH83_2557 [Solirubrobacteraceae bacterium]|nr:hypothetical protein [Solirubrobacteraceae bacterium]